MENIGIVTDSSSDIPPEFAEDFGIKIVPMYIGVEGRMYKDLLEITPEEVYRAIDAGKKITTSAPSAGDYASVFKQLLEKERREIVYCITLSSRLSGACNSAGIAMRSMPGSRIKLFDARTSTICMGLIVMQAAMAVKKGRSAAEIENIINELIEKNRFIATLESFEHVFKGGRTVFFSKIFEKAIRFKSILTIGRNGKVHLVKFVKNRKSAIAEIYRQSVLIAKKNVSNKIGIFYGDDTGPADELKEMIASNREIEVEEIIMSQITTVISAHTGPGIWGVAISPKLV
ncbi:MAG: DegV family protein [Actinobacteria bacterium]|nr:DegV family protein [Actinomycetota bacterium]